MKRKENYCSVSTKRQMHISKVLSSVMTIPVLCLHLKQPVYLSLSLISRFFFFAPRYQLGYITIVLLASHFHSNEKLVLVLRQYFYSSANLPSHPPTLETQSKKQIHGLITAFRERSTPEGVPLGRVYSKVSIVLRSQLNQNN